VRLGFLKSILVLTVVEVCQGCTEDGPEAVVLPAPTAWSPAIELPGVGERVESPIEAGGN